MFLVVIVIYCFFIAIDSINLSPPMNDEIKDGQWLGVMVRSQGRGGKVMVLMKYIFIFNYDI